MSLIFSIETKDKEDRHFSSGFIRFKKPKDNLNFFFVTVYYLSFYFYYGLLKRGKKENAKRNFKAD